MNRQQFISQLKDVAQWDILIIGGGATGLGAAVDAASRGYKTLLLEKYDFAKGTSGRSTKLVHGGVRYLQQGNIKLVMEALRERGMLLRNAPHLVKNQSFIIPNYKWWEGPFYGLGLKLYDIMAGRLGFGATQWLNREETLAHIPQLDPEGLRGGVLYHDGQFDDARLAVNLAQTAAEQGAVLVNYCGVEELIKENGKITGVTAQDSETGLRYEIKAAAIINATGVFVDSLMQMDDPDAEKVVAPSQGIHIVLDKAFLSSENAIMVPHTDDGRVLFAVPWHNRIIVGTTDTAVEAPSFEPVAQEEEIEFLLRHAARYLTRDPQRSDILSIFAGLRPLVKSTGAQNTAAISRDHQIWRSASGMVTITGGKWTTYRKMAEDVINKTAEWNDWPVPACKTRELPIHGHQPMGDMQNHLYVYGSDLAGIEELITQNPALREKIHPELPYLKAEMVWAVRHEMCRGVEDALSRRTRALLINARAALEAAEATARLLAAELGKDEIWITAQVASFQELGRSYLIAN